MKLEFLQKVGTKLLSPERRVSGATTHGHTVAQAATPVLGPRAFVRRLGQFFGLRIAVMILGLTRYRPDRMTKDRTPRMAIGLVKSVAEKETTTSFLWTLAQAKSLLRLKHRKPAVEEMLAISNCRRQRAKRGVSARNPVLVLARETAPNKRVQCLSPFFQGRGFDSRQVHHSPIALANDFEGDDQLEVLGLENEFSVDGDGWVKIAPYGRSVKERTVRGRDGRTEQQTFEQVLDKPAAEEMCRKFDSLWGRLKRFREGIQIYRHHPDLKQHSPETVVPTVGLANSATSCGMFAALEAREDGFYGKPVVSKEGRQAIEKDGLKWLSPFWWVKPAGEKNGIRIVRPTELISAGLTNRPNIPGGQALANQNEQSRCDEETRLENMLREKMIAGLKKLGLALANEATEEQVIIALDSLGPKLAGVTALENEKTTLTQGKTTAETALANEKAAKEKAEKDLGETRTALANERKARIDLVVDGALMAGKITAAERSGWVTRLETGFEAGVTALANEAVKVKVTSITRGAGERKEEGTVELEASEKFTALANERMTKAGVDWKTAWLQIKKEQPALFEAMSNKG